MARKSTIERLDPRIKESVDRLVREGRATIDEILAAIEELGGAVSRSAVGRYVQGAHEQMKRYREAQEVAKVWIGKLEAEPQGDVGRLLSEMLRTVAFQVLGALGDREAEAGAEEIMLLARAIKDLASADKTSADRELRVRREIAARAERTADEVIQAARSQGMSAETAETWRKKILGIAG